MSQTAADLRAQWSNPSDILSLLLLVGGDIVQKAIAQLVGHKLTSNKTGNRGLLVAPVAFSFGWAAYAFTNLISAFGTMTLMPETDYPCMVINCSNGFARTTRSWVLGRLLRDHEIRSPIDTRSRNEGGRGDSLRIDVFVLGPRSTPSRDLVWWSGWATMLLQIGIAIIPWAVYGDWGVMFVALWGFLLVAITCAIPQWEQEKWAGRILTRPKVACVTRGNGYRHIMVLVGLPGSWDVESMATAAPNPLPETPWLSLALAVAWTGLLISISGLRSHTWFLIGIGGIGMLHNVFAAGASRDPAASNLHMKSFSRAPTIIGRREPLPDDATEEVDFEAHDAEMADVRQWVSGKIAHNALPQMPPWIETMSAEDGAPVWLETAKAAGKLGDSQTQASIDRSQEHGVIYAAGGVHGALMELEKWVPTAGLAMVQLFFPGGLAYNDKSIRDRGHKKFWKSAYHTNPIRRLAEEKRILEERWGIDP